MKQSKHYKGMLIFLVITFATGVIFYLYDINSYIIWISAFAEIGGVVAIWIEFRQNRIINEATFVMELNQSFISNEDLGMLEFKLEKYYRFQELLNIDPQDEGYKAILEYLDFQEGIAMLVEQKILSLPAIDTLFANRFFLIMNNPEIQQLELLPEATSYRGCFRLYQKWYAYRKAQNLPVFLEESSLHQLI